MSSNLTLKQLVKITPVDEKIKKRVIEEEASLTDDQKYRISRICWRLLSLIFKSKLREKREEMFKEMAEGAVEYGQDDFKKLEDEVLADLLIKLDEVKTKKEMAEIKAQVRASIEKEKQEDLSPAKNSQASVSEE